MPLYPQGGGLYPNSIDNVLLTDMADSTVKGRAKGAGAGDPQDLTAAQLSLLLGSGNFRNILGRNGGFEVWQRGAGGSANFALPAGSNVYTADGWYCACGTNQNLTISQQSGLVAGSRSCMRIQRDAGQTGIGNLAFQFPLDTDEIVVARGQIVTLSVTLRAGANFSPTSGIVNATLFTGVGPALRRSGGAYTTEEQPIPYTAQPITTTATRYTFTAATPVNAAASQAAVYFYWTPIGVAGAADYFEIDDVQLEIGTVATPFERRPFESELLACMRHYEKSFQYGTAPATAIGSNTGEALSVSTIASTATNFFPTVRFAVRKRITPVIFGYNPITATINVRNLGAGADCGSSAPLATEQGFWLSYSGAAGGTVGQAHTWHWSADAGI